MRKLFLSALVIISFPLFGFSQSYPMEKLNLDFEHIENGYPENWENFGSNNYNISIDSTSANSGKFSAVIENTAGKSDFKALAFNLPQNYKGNSIRLTGNIKTENVTDGYAGLWMRIDLPAAKFGRKERRQIEN